MLYKMDEAQALSKMRTIFRKDWDRLEVILQPWSQTRGLVWGSRTGKLDHGTVPIDANEPLRELVSPPRCESGRVPSLAAPKGIPLAVEYV